MGLCSIFGLMAELLPVLQHQECLSLQPNKLKNLFSSEYQPHTKRRHAGMVSWRTSLCGCKRHTSCCSVEKCRGIHFLTNDIWLEQHFHVKETYADSDDVSVWELVDNILQFIPNRSNHLDLIVDETSAVSSFVMRSTIPWNRSCRRQHDISQHHEGRMASGATQNQQSA